MLYFKKLFALLALLSLSIGANASTFVNDLGTLGPASVGTPAVLVINESFAAGAVDHYYTFDINTAGLPSAAGASVTSIVFDTFGFSIFNIDNFEFALTDSNGTAITGFAGSGESVILDPVANSTYGILFKGTATGLSGGMVNGPVVLSSVPVPAAAWLFGSALIGMVGVSRSRKATV
jgi:hypothetical protein